MKKSFIFIVALTVCFTSCLKRHNDQGKFAGTWKLVKWVATDQDGKTTSPFGEDAIGQLRYDIKGNMMVMIMKRDRKEFSTNNFLAGTPEEIVPAFSGFLAYYGTYTVVQDSGKVIHHIRASLFPNWVNNDQVRFYSFKGNKLTLRTPIMDNIKHELTWERID